MATIHGTAAMGRPHRLAVLWRSTIGKKYVAAVTGVLLAGFVIALAAAAVLTAAALVVVRRRQAPT